MSCFVMSLLLSLNLPASRCIYLMYKNKVGILPVVDNDRIQLSQTVIFSVPSSKYPVMEKKESVNVFRQKIGWCSEQIIHLIVEEGYTSPIQPISKLKMIVYRVRTDGITDTEVTKKKFEENSLWDEILSHICKSLLIKKEPEIFCASVLASIGLLVDIRGVNPSPRIPWASNRTKANGSILLMISSSVLFHSVKPRSRHHFLLAIIAHTVYEVVTEPNQMWICLAISSGLDVTMRNPFPKTSFTDNINDD